MSVTSPRAQLPLKRVDAPGVQGAPSLSAVATDAGVLIGTRDGLRLFSHDLQETLWHYPTDGWTNAVVVTNEVVWYGAVGGKIFALALRDGSPMHEISCGQGQVRHLSGDVVLVRGVGEFQAWHVSGTKLWARESVLAGASTATQDSFVIAEQSGATVASVDSVTGSEHWNIRLAPVSGPRAVIELASLPAGFPSLTAVDGGLLLINGARDVMFVSASDGELIRSARAPLPGIFSVTPEGVQFFKTTEFSVFDWRTMAEVERQSFASETESLNGTAQRGAFGFVATENSIIWSVPHGTLMGVQRHASGRGGRKTWRADVGGLMPIAANPFAFGDFVYWVTHPAHDSDTPAQLIAFRSEAS